MDLGLTGKVAVITGGSEGIGRGIALRFLEEGAKVAICARRDDVLQQATEELRALTGGTKALSKELLPYNILVTTPNAEAVGLLGGYPIKSFGYMHST